MAGGPAAGVRIDQLRLVPAADHEAAVWRGQRLELPAVGQARAVPVAGWVEAWNVASSAWASFFGSSSKSDSAPCTRNAVIAPSFCAANAASPAALVDPVAASVAPRLQRPQKRAMLEAP